MTLDYPRESLLGIDLGTTGVKTVLFDAATEHHWPSAFVLIRFASATWVG